MVKSSFAQREELINDLNDNTSDGMFSLLNQMLFKQPTDEAGHIYQDASGVTDSNQIPPIETVSRTVNPTRLDNINTDQQESAPPRQEQNDPIPITVPVSVPDQQQQLQKPIEEENQDQPRTQDPPSYHRRQRYNNDNPNDDDEQQKYNRQHISDDDSEEDNIRPLQRHYQREYDQNDDDNSRDDEDDRPHYPLHRYRRRTNPNSITVPAPPIAPPVTNNINISTNIKCDVVNNVINNGVTYKDTVDANSYGHGTSKYVNNNVDGIGPVNGNIHNNVHKNVTEITVNNVINSIDLNDPRRNRNHKFHSLQNHKNIVKLPKNINNKVHNTFYNHRSTEHLPNNENSKLPIFKQTQSQRQIIK